MFHISLVFVSFRLCNHYNMKFFLVVVFFFIFAQHRFQMSTRGITIKTALLWRQFTHTHVNIPNLSKQMHQNPISRVMLTNFTKLTKKKKKKESSMFLVYFLSSLLCLTYPPRSNKREFVAQTSWEKEQADLFVDHKQIWV